MATNKELLLAVCQQLEPLLDQLVLVGGCSMELLITDNSAVIPRTTQDVDMVVQVLSRNDYYALEQQLRDVGFKQAMNEEVICRWRDGWKVLDILPSNDGILGFSNPWYPAAIETALSAVLGGLNIRYNSPAAFLATKIEAFRGRGKSDFRTSHDFEDMVTLVDGRDGIVSDIDNANVELKKHIVEAFCVYSKLPLFEEYVSGHLAPDSISQRRLNGIMQKFEAITQLSLEKE